MGDRRHSRDETVGGGNAKSDCKGGGKSMQGGPEVDPVGNLRTKGLDPSPDNRRRGEIASR